MHVQTLEYVVYDTDGYSGQSHILIEPTWIQIETAIQRLDKFSHPYVLLWPTADKIEQEMTAGHEWFEVMGGQGDYWFALTKGDYSQRRYLNSMGSQNEIAVWLSDQGFADSGHFICHDLNIVIQAVRYYAEYGGFSPEVTWE